jgi:hypothetical protein
MYSTIIIQSINTLRDLKEIPSTRYPEEQQTIMIIEQ